MIPEITVVELKEMMDNGSDFQLIDVREPFENEMVNIGAQLIPMGTVPQHIDEISTDKKVIIHCKSGARSGNIVQFLKTKGFDNVYNLKGGIFAWIDQIDPNLPKY
jgi:adenylyltransferase/sulfurtransferase